METTLAATTGNRTPRLEPAVTTILCEMTECIDALHIVMDHDPSSVDSHRALRIERNGENSEFPAAYLIEVFLASDGRWKVDLYAPECYADGDETATLLADLQKASDLAAELNAEVNA